MHRLNAHFIAKDEPTSNETDLKRDIRKTRWYGASRSDLRNGISILTELREDISQNGPLHLERWKDQIIKAFGIGFYDALSEWQDMKIDAMYLAETLQQHAETFNMSLPASSRPPDGVKVIADPKQKLQMLVKLIDLQAQHLLDLQHSNSEASDMRQTTPNEFAPRYFATASRDLQRSVDWYLYLRSNDL